jgi:hypothetical protein
MSCGRKPSPSEGAHVRQLDRTALADATDDIERRRQLYEATYKDSIFGPVSLDSVKDVLKKFTEALDRRGLAIVAYPGVQDWFTETQHPLRELEAFFDTTSSSTLQPNTAGIVVRHLHQKVDELKSMAAEIDLDWRIET